MNHLSRVLVGVDFSKPARRAFEQALALSRHHGAELVVVQAVPADQPFAQRGQARLALAERLRQAAAEANVEFAHRVQTGDPAEIVLLHARSLRPDVIVVGTHQRRGVGRLRQGSVAERVAASATVPVLVVPAPRREFGAIRPFCHVAVAVDFGPASRGAIEHALALANESAARVTLLHVMDGLSSKIPVHWYGYGLEEGQKAQMRDAHRRLQWAIPPTPQSPAVVDTRVLRGDITSGLTRAVDSLGADLLVVGVHKQGAVSRALFGTTVTRLLRVAGVPVLAVPVTAAASAGEQATSPLQQAA